MLRVFKFPYVVRSNDYGDKLLDSATEDEANELIKKASEEGECLDTDTADETTADDKGIYEALTSKKYDSLGYNSIDDINTDIDSVMSSVEINAHSIDGCESAIVGVTDDGKRLVYDYDLIIEALMENDDCDESAATEWYDYNIARSFPYYQPSPIVLHAVGVVEEEDGEDALVNAIDMGLSNRYVVLEGDRDTLYVKDRTSDRHYAIHVSECAD